MSMKRELASLHVCVEIPEPWLLRGKSPEARAKRMEREADDVMQSIRRHVDDVGHMWVEREYEYSCAHCGWAWDHPADSLHNGGCCAQDAAVAWLVEGAEYTHTGDDLTDDYWISPDVRENPVLSAVAGTWALHLSMMEAAA